MTAADPLDVRLELLDVEAMLPLRQSVLRPHQTVEDVRFPGDLEPTTGHFGAVLPTGHVVGVVTVMQADAPWGGWGGWGGWRLRGMATAEAIRGTGVGSRLLAAALDHVRANGGRLVWCNARLAAGRFYERAGLLTWGKPWDEPGIGGHVVMWRAL